MADITWRSLTERLDARGAPALLVTIDGDGWHRVYFDAMGDPHQLAQCCATVLAMMKENGDLAARALQIVRDGEGTGELRVPDR